MLTCMSVMAGERGIIFLFTNGQKASFKFASKPEIKVNDDVLTVTDTDVDSISYSFADVDYFYFDDMTITGNSQAVAPTTSENPIFKYANGVITASGLKSGERLTVVSVNGSIITNTQANTEGNAQIDISHTAPGIYIVGTGSGVSFKLLKK